MSLPLSLGLALLALFLTVAPASAQLFGNDNAEAQRRQAELTLRVSQLEGQLRNLNGQIEQLNFQLRQMQDLMQKMQKDMEFRLQELENGAATPKKPLKKSELTPPAAIEEPTPAIGIAPPRTSIAPPGGPTPPAGLAAPVPPGTIGARPGVGAPPQVLGRIPASDDPIAGVIGQGPLDLSEGQRPEASALPAPTPTPIPVDPSTQPVPGVSPKYAVAKQTPSARDEYDAAYGYILSGEYDLAERSFKTFLGNHPTDRRAGSAQFWLGESYFQRNQHREATDAFLKSYTQYPDDVKAPDSLLKLGLAYQGLGERKAACNAYDELLSKYPKASKALRDRAQAEKSRGKCS